MGGHVPRNQFNAVGCAVDSAFLGKLLFQVGALRITQVGRDLVKPAVHSLFVDVQFWHTLFVKQGGHGFVFYRPLHGVSVHDGAKLVGRLFILQQGRSGEGNVGGIGQGLFHALVRLAAVAAVAFVHQHDQVGRIVVTLWKFGRRAELVHQGEGDALCAAANALGQIAA